MPTPVELCVRGTASGSGQASHVCSLLHLHCVLGTRSAAPAYIASASVATLSLGLLRCLRFCHAGCCSTIESADATRRMRLGCCTALFVVRGLLAGVLLGIGVQSGHRELEHGERGDRASVLGRLRFLRFIECDFAAALRSRHTHACSGSQHRHASDVGLHGSRRRRARQTHGRVRLAETGV